MNETSSKRSEEGRTAIEYSLEAEAMVFMCPTGLAEATIKRNNPNTA
jgi:hypothetical protein